MKRNLLLAAALIFWAAACSDSTGGGTITKPPGGLTYLHLASTAPALCNDSVIVVATKGGQDVDMGLTFPTASDPCPDGEDFIRLKLDKDALLNRPDGTPMSNGDTITIKIVWEPTDSALIFHLEPTGLTFDPAHKAELRISFGETEEHGDSTVLRQISIWRQPTPIDDFQKLASTKLDAEEELEVKLTGFSRYAIAY
jgi:hypothetical protein